MLKILRRGWIGLLVFVIALTLANFLCILSRRAIRRACGDFKAEQYRGEIIRDGYGVPHIYGQRDVDVAFALAYAHAEDDFKTFQQLLPFYRGDWGAVSALTGLRLIFCWAGWMCRARSPPALKPT